MPFSPACLFKTAFAICLSAFLALCPAMAQNTGGVFGPVVNEGHRSAQYRVAIVPDAAGGETAHAHRLHYQQAANGAVMWRLVAQAADRSGADLDFDFLQAELFWQVTPDDRRWQSGFRFDARLRDNGRPGQLGVNWTNQWALGEDWSARFVALSAVQVGDNAADGIFLQTRANIARELDSGLTIGAEMFNDYGSTENIGGFDEQRHQIGPFVSTPLGGPWSIFASALVGASDSAADTDLRIWLGRSF